MPAASRGYDGGKKVPGRKRHIVTDTLGLLLAVAVTAANIGDRDAAAGLLRRLRRLHRDTTLVWADGGYTGSLVGWCRDELALTLEILKPTDDMAGFVVLPRRWVAERTSEGEEGFVMSSRISQRIRRRRNQCRWANARSTAQRCAPRPEPCSVARRAISGFTPKSLTSRRYLSWS